VGEPDGEDSPESGSSPARDGALRAARWGAGAAVLAAVLAAVVTGVFSLWAATIGGGDPHGPAADASDPAASPGPSVSSSTTPETAHKDDAGIPVLGPVRIHPAESADLCLTDGRIRDGSYHSAIAVQRRCDDPHLPRVTLEPVAGGTYHIVWENEDGVRGCLATIRAQPESAAEGMLEPQNNCDNATQFGIERVDPHGPGYRFRAHGSENGCVDVGDGSPESAEAVMRPCSDRIGQTFTIETV
jgi:hypothetical protein